MAPPQATYQTGRLVLAPGENVYLYSDGVTEAHDPGDDLRLRAPARGRGSGRMQVAAAANSWAALTEARKNFVGTAPPSDDMTHVALRWLDAAAL